MERQEWEIFLALCEELHFGRTALRLHLSQAAVSQTIKKLERRIGAPLFERTSRQVRLTELGDRLRTDLEPHVHGLDRAVRKAVDAARGVAGILPVGFSTPWSGKLVLDIAEAFTQRHPGCEIVPHEIQLYDPFGPIRSRKVDVQITEFPVREADLATGSIVFSEPRTLVVPARHPFTERASISLEDLGNEPFITLAGAVPDYWVAHHFFRVTPSGKPIPQTAPVQFFQEMLTMVAAGKGVFGAAAAAADFYSRADIAFVPIDDAPPIEYGLVWRAGDATARVRAFLEAVPEFIG